MRSDRMIAREVRPVEVYLDSNRKEFIRFLVSAYFESLPVSAETLLKPLNGFVIRYSDGSACIDATCLVPLDSSDAELEQTAGRFADTMREFLGRSEVGKLIDCAWVAGHGDTRWDDLLTREEQNIILLALGRR